MLVRTFLGVAFVSFLASFGLSQLAKVDGHKVTKANSVRESLPQGPKAGL